MKVVSWRGWEPEDDGIWIGVNDAVIGSWNPTFSTAPRSGAAGVVTAVTIGDRTIGCEFGDNGSVSRTIETMWALALQRLNPLDTSAGELVVTFDNGVTEWAVDARITLPGSVVDGTIDVFDVVWYTPDPLWHLITTDTASSVVTATAITNPSFATNTAGWTKGSDPTNVTSAFSRDAAVYSDAAGSGKIVVSANTGAGGTLYVLNDTEFPASEGDYIQLKGAFRTTNGQELDGNGVDPFPYIGFYNASDVLVGGSVTNAVGGQQNDTWEIGYIASGTAPATTSYFKIGTQILIGAGDLGTAYFDEFEFVTGPFTSTEFTIGGNAPTNLTVTMTPAGNFPQSIKARHFTITNNGTKTLYNHPFEVSLGNNSASAINGTYWALLRDGKPQPCQISDYDTVAAYMWLVIDHLPVGASIDYTLLVSDQTVLPGVAYNFDSYTAPAFDISTAYVTTTVGSSSTVTQIPTGLGSEVDKWIGGYMTILSGAQAGTTIELTDSSATTVTHAALGGGALASGVSVLVRMSNNSRWVNPVRKTERSDSQRGLWWLSSGQKKPNRYDMKVPGAWAWDLYYDNRDNFVQTPFLGFNPGGTADYVAIMDVKRSYEGSIEFLDQGGHDGVSITTPVPITAARLDYQFRNPNSMCEFVVGSRQENGATAWTHEYSDVSANATLTNMSIQNVTFEPDTYAVGLFVIPNGADEIGAGWQGDEGTATSATSTTITDTGKEWIADQFIGGQIRIVSGVGAGQYRAITDNTATVITTAAWTTTPDSTSRYQIINANHYAIGRNHTYLHLTLDSSDITCSAVSAETDAYVLYRDLFLNEETAPAVYTTIQRVAVNPETTGRHIVIEADESLVIDGPNMTAYIADTATGDFINTVPPLAYTVYEVDADATQRLASSWLEVTPGDHTLSIATDEGGVSCDVDVAWIESRYS